MVIDFESTGLLTETDDVVQLAMPPFDYEVESGRMPTVHKALAFEGFREPAAPNSDEAGLVTGITNEMVAGILHIDQIVDHNKFSLYTFSGIPFINQVVYTTVEFPWYLLEQ